MHAKDTAMGTRHAKPMAQSKMNITTTNTTGVMRAPTKSGNVWASTDSVWPAQPSITLLSSPVECSS